MPSDFKKLLCARFLYTFAVQMQAVILGWRVYELLKDPLSLGLIGLTEAVPALGLALYAGYLVDRLKPLMVYRRVMYVSLASGLLVLAEHIWQSHVELSIQIGLLYSAAFLTGLARSFSQPAIYAITPRLVERSLLTRATATSSSFMQVARIGGPAFGGLVFGFFGTMAASSLVCLFLILASLATVLIRQNLPAPEQRKEHKSVKDELLSGGRFVLKHPILFPALTLDMVSVLFGGVTALLPIFAEEVLFVGPKGLGALRAAPAVGATIMSLYLSQTHRLRTGKWLFSAVAGFGCSILLFAASQNFYLSMAALILSGSFDSISMVIRSTAVQLSSPDHMRGKISAVNSIFIGSSNELGELESGLAAKFMGVVPSVWFGGIICLCTVAVTAFLSPTLRKLDLNEMAKS